MELLPGIHRVNGVSSNVYLIVDPDGLALVDTGMPGSARRILRYVKKLGYPPSAIRHILLTHQHPDHVGGAAALMQATGAAVAAHALDAPAIAGTAARDLPRNPLVRRLFKALILQRLKPVPVPLSMEDGERLPVLTGEGGLQVVATPGHTAGHVAFYLVERRLLFAGDAYVHRRGRIVPPPRMFTRDPAEARRSMAELTRFDIEASLPGHGQPILHGGGQLLAATVKRRH